MDKGYAIERYKSAAALLSSRWQRLALQLPEDQQCLAEEIRLRAGQPMTVLLPDGEIYPSAEIGTVVMPNDLEQLCDTVTGYSRYAVTESISRGYITARGGFRLGICGTAVIKNGCNTNMRDISSVIIRIAREMTGVGSGVLPQLLEDGVFHSTLIIASPGAGKTTLLRDLIRGLSDGSALCPPQRVAVVDERSEIAVMYQGLPQMSIGKHTDVLDACPKAIGIPLLVRSANPQIIAVDEITAAEDIRAILAASNCGVRFLATIHAADKQELQHKPLYAKLLKANVFSSVVTIGKDRQYRVEKL